MVEAVGGAELEGAGVGGADGEDDDVAGAVSGVSAAEHATNRAHDNVRAVSRRRRVT